MESLSTHADKPIPSTIVCLNGVICTVFHGAIEDVPLRWPENPIDVHPILLKVMDESPDCRYGGNQRLGVGTRGQIDPLHPNQSQGQEANGHRLLEEPFDI